MLAYQSNITTIPNNPVINQTAYNTFTPNKRGCCQTKRRNYNLITSSNGIDAPNNKSCCSKPDDKPKESSCNTKNCSCNSSENKNNFNIPKKSKYTKSDVESARKEFDRLVSKGEIKLNEYLDIFEPGSSKEIEPYSEEQVKTKLLNTELQLDVVSRVDKATNSININIVDTTKNKKYLDQTFRIKQYEPDLEKFEESISILTISRWLGLQNLYSKSEKYPKKKRETQEFAPKKMKKSDCKNLYGIDSECMCINHDMGCSGITTKSGDFQFWTVCAGSFVADVFECCYYHDIGLWCTDENWVYRNLFDPAILGADLISCFEERIFQKYREETNPLCRFFELPVLLSVLALPLLLSPLLGLALQGAPDRRNVDGSHSDSCLCGGNKPTYCCKGGGHDGVCRDKCCNEVELCSYKVDKTRGQGCEKKQECGKKCTYSVQPNAYNPNVETLRNYRLRTNEVEYFSIKDPQKKLSKSDCCTVNLPNKCTEKCFNCYYACKLNPNGKGLSWSNGKVFIDSSHLSAGMRGIPCCEGTPNEDLNDKSNYCPEDYGKGSRGLPLCGSPIHKKNGGPCIEVGKEVNSSNRLISGF